MIDKQLKPSKYNFFAEDFNGDLIITNLLFNTFAKVSKDKKNLVLSILKGNLESSHYQQSIIDNMNKFNFLIDCDLDEGALLDLQYYNIVYSDERLEITIIPTDACDFNCIYCYQDNECRNYMTEDVQERLIKYLKKNIKKHQQLVISWFGGEPLLAKKTVLRIMEEIKDICTRASVPFVSRMSTNGFNLDFETFQKLTSLHVLHYQITIDGVPEIHNKQRPHKSGKNSFDTIVDNLKKIRDDYKSKNISIGLRINTTPQIVERMNDFLDFLQQEFGDDKRFSIIWEWVRDWGGEKILYQNHAIVKSPSLLTAWMDESTKRGLSSIDLYLFKNGLGLCEACKKNGYIINYDGTVCKCTLAINDANYRNTNTVGILDPFGKMNIDNKKLSKWLIREPKEKCLECVVLPYCMSASCPYGNKILQSENCPPIEELLPYLLRNYSSQGKIPTLEGDNIYGS